jgi:hypothetical protein
MEGDSRSYTLVHILDKKNDPSFDGSFFFGRGERTQTFDLSVPNRARYQLRHTPMVNTIRINRGDYNGNL